MDACPFCHTEVSEHLARFGGKCPSCFALIPGEEAATDPGESARAAQERSHRPSAARRWLLPVTAVLVALVLVAAAGWTLLKPEPVATVLDFDDAGYAVDSIQFVAFVEPPPEPVATPRPTAPRPSSAGTDATEAVAAEPEPTDAVAVVEPEPAPQVGGLQFGLEVGVARRAAQGVRLTDDEAIVEMIKDVLTAESPKLKSCYEQRLKTREDLAGHWMLSLVVTRDGKPRDVAMTGIDAQDAELESCVATKVAGWSFTPIRADQPIQKTLGFTPGF